MMRKPFLESLSEYLIQHYGSELGELTIILPNRRARLFLQRHLANLSVSVQWSPNIYSIDDYLGLISPLKGTDPVELLFTLYDIYVTFKEHPEPFDEFYHWGEIMLRDFDEIDKYLVDAQMLFSNILDLKELEDPMAGMDEEQLVFIRQFWDGFNEGDFTPEKEKFLDIWNLLPKLYLKLRETLLLRTQGYKGMQYRELVDQIDAGGISLPGSGKICIAGFNALNGCEKRIFAWLKDRGAEFFWDYDQSYIKDQILEAGKFLRGNLEQFPETASLEGFDGINTEKEIRIFELPTDILQAKTVHKILEESGSGRLQDCTDTAVVLCDEELLMPVVMSLPNDIEEINVTMGYPMKNTPVFSFIEILLHLQSGIRTGSNGAAKFYHKDITAILIHPYLREFNGEKGHLLLDAINKHNQVYLEAESFQGDIEQKIFRKVETSMGLVEYLRNIFLHVLESLTGREDRLHQDLDREFIFQLLIHLNKLEMLVEERPSISMPVLVRLFRKLVADLRVPFEGEPLSGLQIMGILETRLLDFRHVILLSMNEEVMPGSSLIQSYVPYALRVGYGLPAREDMDAIYAYYFNRLLQRADQIDLLYNSRSEGVRTGEMSRYLYQLIYERDLHVIRPGMEVMAVETAGLSIRHTSEIGEKLKRYLVDQNEDKYLSPSAINTYMDCSLKFYLRYIAGIGEPDEVQEEIDAAGFGTVVHEAIRELYTEIAERNDGSILSSDLETLQKNTSTRDVLRKAFLETHFKGRKKSDIEGRNIIIFNVMLRYLNKIIDTDLQFAPFTLLSVESDHSKALDFKQGNQKKQVRLGGKIDRVDQVDDKVRVIDYKTGNANQTFPGIAELFDSGLRSRNGAAFQTLFYAWLVKEAHPMAPITPGLYVMRKLYEDNFDPALIMGSRQQQKRISAFSDVESGFVDHLREVIVKIFDPGTPFVQTEIESRCRICDFSTICNRKSIE